LREQVRTDGAPWGIMPSPVGEPEGLDTVRLVATLRLALPEVAHVLLDVAALGPRLAQMALGFGGDELWAPIVSERALRLGANANNPAMTRKEAAILIRGAGLLACERTGADTYSEEPA
jgi:cyclic dehypoxanthinyl futalosine synthase